MLCPKPIQSQARHDRPAPPKRLTGRGWSEPGAAGGVLPLALEEATRGRERARESESERASERESERARERERERACWMRSELPCFRRRRRRAAGAPQRSGGPPAACQAGRCRRGRRVRGFCGAEQPRPLPLKVLPVLGGVGGFVSNGGGGQWGGRLSRGLLDACLLAASSSPLSDT